MCTQRQSGTGLCTKILFGTGQSSIGVFYQGQYGIGLCMYSETVMYRSVNSHIESGTYLCTQGQSGKGLD